VIGFSQPMQNVFGFQHVLWSAVCTHMLWFVNLGLNEPAFELRPLPNLPRFIANLLFVSVACLIDSVHMSHCCAIKIISAPQFWCPCLVLSQKPHASTHCSPDLRGRDGRSRECRTSKQYVASCWY